MKKYWKLVDQRGETVDEFVRFDDAVQALAGMPGEWSCNWSVHQLCKGVFAVEEII